MKKWSTLSGGEKAIIIFAVGTVIIIPLVILFIPTFQRMLDKTKVGDMLLSLQNTIIGAVYDNSVAQYSDKNTISSSPLLIPESFQQKQPNKLAYIDAYQGSDKDAFQQKVEDVADDEGIDPNSLMGIMFFESKLNPAKQNSIGATGLIQFLPGTAEGLGTSTDELKQMSAIEQMDYVQKYLHLFKNRYSQPVDIYLSVFFPIAVGKSDDFVLEKKPEYPAAKVAAANPIFDTTGKGYITVADVKQIMQPYLGND